MASKLLTAGSLLLLAGLTAAVPQAQYSTASQNTTGDTPATTAFTSAATPTPSSYAGPASTRYFSPALLLKGSDTKPRLSQSQTNGNSNLGTIAAPKLPRWLSGPLPQGYPWGSRTAKNTNPYTDPPDTGVTRYYTFHITEQTIQPDGVERPGLVINGGFPAPTIEANWGDWFDITVYNDMTTEGTSLHWHGLLQSATPWFDGVPAVQQCPIAPGSSFTYRFRADLYGTSWYHSHYSAQYNGGLLGAMIIYGPNSTAYDIDLGPVLLTDWYHQSYYDLVEQVMAPASENLFPPVSNNNLINGKMNYPCANATGLVCTPNAGISKFTFQSGKKHLLRLINAGSEGIQKFSIDGYTLTVVANDFVPIEPYETDVVTLGIGQRSDVIVEATGKPTDAVWMRSTLGPSFFVGGCTLNDGISPEAVAAIYYENANTSAVPTTQSSIPASVLETCQNDPLSSTVPVYPIAPPVTPETEEIIDITFQNNGTHNVWYMNNSTFRADYNSPVLLDAKLGQTDFPSEWNVFDFHESKSIRLIFYNWAQAGAHPMHLHGHNMYVLDFGTGTWNGQINNPSNPQRRDVQLLPPAPSSTVPGYVVVQYDADNPGVWPFHCHIAWHVSGGLYINTMELRRQIEEDMSIPSIMAQTCRDWSAWTGDNVVPEIDSGL